MNTPEKELRDLNPQILSIEIGIQNLEKLALYPLSVGDQLEVSDAITEVINTFLSMEANKGRDDAALISVIIEIVSKNIYRILGYATCIQDEIELKKLLKKITNVQLSEIILKIIDMNYKAVEKNLGSLFEKISKVFLSQRQSQPSVNPMDTDSKISSENPIKKGESPLVN